MSQSLSSFAQPSGPKSLTTDSLVQIEIYKILQRYLILIGVISIVFVVLLSLSNLADKGEGREVLAPTHSFSE